MMYTCAGGLLIGWIVVNMFRKSIPFSIISLITLPLMWLPSPLIPSLHRRLLELAAT